MTPEKIKQLAENNYGTEMGYIRGSNTYDLEGDRKNGFIKGYTQCKETILEALELHIQLNEHDWNRNPQAQLKDFIQSLNNMKNTEEIKYSKTPFEGHTHRFIVEFEIGQPNTSNLHIYSNSDSYQKLDDFINAKKSDKVISFKIIHRASKEQDQMASKFIDEIFNEL